MSPGVAGAEYRAVVRQAVLAVASSFLGKRTAWAQVGTDPAGEVVLREAAADLWGAAEDTGEGRDLDLVVVHVGRYRGASPHLDMAALLAAQARVRVGRHFLIVARTSEPYRFRDDGLWGRIQPHTVFACGDSSVLWVTRGMWPGDSRAKLVVVPLPRADTPPKKPARRVVRRSA